MDQLKHFNQKKNDKNVCTYNPWNNNDNMFGKCCFKIDKEINFKLIDF